MAWVMLHDGKKGKKYPAALLGGKPKYASFLILEALVSAEPLVSGVAYWAGEPGLVRILVDDDGLADEGVVDTAMADYAE